MEPLQTRLEALEQQMSTVTRRLHWWRSLACGAVVLAVLTWALPAVIAQEEDAMTGQKGLAQRVAALETLLKHFSHEKNEIFITGANLHIVNGLGQTGCGSEEEPIPDCPNGLGNLIVGYNEPREPDFGENIRTGSHNVVVGQRHNFSRFGGLVVGDLNTISGNFSSVTGGQQNTTSGEFSSVSGGEVNTAGGFVASVSGGRLNTASFDSTSVSGGAQNSASGLASAVSGGRLNTASGNWSSVSGGGSLSLVGPGNTASGLLSAVCGGDLNTASGEQATVSGGFGNTASGEFSSVSGGGQDPNTGGEGPGNEASGLVASVSGGNGNTASGLASAVSGGQNITQETPFGWSAGSEAEEVVVGNFRSP